MLIVKERSIGCILETPRGVEIIFTLITGVYRFQVLQIKEQVTANVIFALDLLLEILMLFCYLAAILLENALVFEERASGVINFNYWLLSH